MPVSASVRRRRLTDEAIQALKPKAKRYTKPDSQEIGLYVLVHPSGRKTFVAIARDGDGKQIWTTIRADGIEHARAQAKSIISRVKAGLPAIEPPRQKPKSFAAVSDKWFKWHVIKNGLLSRHEVERLLNTLILPRFGDREFTSIRRSEIVHALDAIEAKHGARQAEYVLAIVRKMMNWHASRNDDFVSPIVPGMRRYDTEASKRKRILDDDELHAVWKAATDANGNGNGTFGAIVRLLLLTAQRREKILTMRWSDITDDGVWRVPSAKRQKGVGGDLVLPPVALEIIQAQPRIVGNPFVFAGRSDRPFNSRSKAKRALDARCGVTGWTLHDCRRTARSLMARAKVPTEHAERVLGHTVRGVEGIYDRYEYRDEKADALRRLAALIAGIVHPPADADNIVQLHRDRQAQS